MLAAAAFKNIAFYLRSSHLKQLSEILTDKNASENDRFVAYSLIQNAIISAEAILPMCQDTGTANIIGWKGESVLTDADDAEWLAANPHRLGRVHVHNFDLGPNLPPLPIITLCVRLHDVTAPDGWTAAWLEIMPEPDFYGADDDEPSFAPAEWAEVAHNPVKEAGWILGAIAYAARTSAPAATVRNLLVAVRAAELGSAAQHFRFIEND
jgi:hypothetical protein